MRLSSSKQPQQQQPHAVAAIGDAAGYCRRTRLESPCWPCWPPPPEPRPPRRRRSCSRRPRAAGAACSAGEVAPGRCARMLLTLSLPGHHRADSLPPRSFRPIADRGAATVAARVWRLRLGTVLEAPGAARRAAGSGRVPFLLWMVFQPPEIVTLCAGCAARRPIEGHRPRTVHGPAGGRVQACPEPARTPAARSPPGPACHGAPKVCPCVADLARVPPCLVSAFLSTPAALRTPGVCSGGDSAF